MTSLFGPTADPLPTVGYAHVALEQNIDAAPDGLTYSIPESLADLAPGQRVMVPLGRGDKPVSGYVIDVTVGRATPPRLPPEAKIKPILSRDPKHVALTADLIYLARWMARYYCCPLGMVLLTMLPAAVKRGTGTVSVRMVEPAPPPSDAGDGPPPKLTKLQRSVVQAVTDLAERCELPVEVNRLAQLAGARSVVPVNALIDKGVLRVHQQERVRAATDPLGLEAGGPGPADHTVPVLNLTADQRAADGHLRRYIRDGFSVHLLHGVTGSGKTEVYLRAIEHLAEGTDNGAAVAAPGAIVLVPEISLTPQTVARFTARFDGVAVLHSGLTAAQRHEQWRRIRAGRARIVVGARSAVFAPLPRVGVIIVDEEHDTSFKQDQLPRYHGRDVAIKRAQLLGVPVILGSATPSLESFHHAAGADPQRRYHLITLPRRVGGVPMPPVRVVDMATEPRDRGRVPQISRALRDSLRTTLDAGGQSILLLNRRGYASYIGCPDQRCGWMMACDDCDANMVFHKDVALPSGGLVRCHHCHAEQLLPRHCPMCAKRVITLGTGTQRIEEELRDLVPGAQLLRMDADTMHTARDYQQGLDAFASGGVDVLLGTQMIAKGLDFPNVRLVGVVSADTALHIPDFRAAERTFCLVAQVAGRAGRTPDHTASVVVQTMCPEDPAITLAARHDYDGFARRELAVRERFGLPPFARVARLVVRDRDLGKCNALAAQLAGHLNESNLGMGGAVKVSPPLPCPISRIAGHYRVQIELSAPAAQPLQELMTRLRNSRLLRADAHTAIDVDPIAFM